MERPLSHVYFRGLIYSFWITATFLLRLVTFYDVFVKTPLDLSGWHMLAGLIVASISKNSVFRSKNINVKDEKISERLCIL